MNGKKRRDANRRKLIEQLERQMQPTGNSDPSKLNGNISGPGGPRDQGAVVLDPTDVVLMDDIQVSAIDTYAAGNAAGPAVYMTLGGKVNKQPHRAQVGFIFGLDGTAALISELIALAERAGIEATTDLVQRLAELQRDGNADLHFLRAAIDTAIESVHD